MPSAACPLTQTVCSRKRLHPQFLSKFLFTRKKTLHKAGSYFWCGRQELRLWRRAPAHSPQGWCGLHPCRSLPAPLRKPFAHANASTLNSCRSSCLHGKRPCIKQGLIFGAVDRNCAFGGAPRRTAHRAGAVCTHAVRCLPPYANRLLTQTPPPSIPVEVPVYAKIRPCIKQGLIFGAVDRN